MMAAQRTMIDLWTKSILFWVRNLSVKIADFKRKCYGYMIHWLCISWMFFPIFSIIRKIHSPKQFYPKKKCRKCILYYSMRSNLWVSGCRIPKHQEVVATVALTVYECMPWCVTEEAHNILILLLIRCCSLFFFSISCDIRQPHARATKTKSKILLYWKGRKGAESLMRLGL